ncbi:MAG TPA: hypothetical protein VHE34_22510 [Puia sp.]|uniref:hypothetical protein n=1 Tax=Puia sp. TaxID=2045100 RepID=UPI002BB85516|nr:hypothetical protein [Puia sp.]HVU98021.1 hypothetical protein [Puia sp.]
MSPKLALAFLLAASATLVKGQNNAADSIRDSYHIFFPAMGKDILAAHIGDHFYKIVNVYNKPSEVYVDSRPVAGDELAKYSDVIARIKSSIKDDDEDREMRQMERERRQAERDEHETAREQERQQRDRERQQRDREQRDFERQRDRERQQREHEQQQRERAQEKYESDAVYRETSDSDCRSCDEDYQRSEEAQREQSAEDRAMLKKGIQVLVEEHVIGNSGNLRSLVLTDTDISVNGVRQPQNIYQQMRSRLGDWASHGFSYGAAGSADNYSLSIVD